MGIGRVWLKLSVREKRAECRKDAHLGPLARRAPWRESRALVPAEVKVWVGWGEGRSCGTLSLCPGISIHPGARASKAGSGLLSLVTFQLLQPKLCSELHLGSLTPLCVSGFPQGVEVVAPGCPSESPGPALTLSRQSGCDEHTRMLCVTMKPHNQKTRSGQWCHSLSQWWQIF